MNIRGVAIILPTSSSPAPFFSGKFHPLMQNVWLWVDMFPKLSQSENFLRHFELGSNENKSEQFGVNCDAAFCFVEKNSLKDERWENENRENQRWGGGTAFEPGFLGPAYFRVGLSWFEPGFGCLQPRVLINRKQMLSTHSLFKCISKRNILEDEGKGQVQSFLRIKR